MDIIEKLAGDTRRNLRERDWPSPRSKKSFLWPPFAMLRGSVLLAAGCVIDQDDVDRELQEAKREWDRINAEAV